MSDNYNPAPVHSIDSGPYGQDFTREAFERALSLMKEAVQDERSDELLYDYLISVAPTEEEKQIITSIRNDERNHRAWYREMYKFYTGQDIQSTDSDEFVPPASYLAGIRKAIFGELGAMEKYRFIREGLPSRYYRDIVFRILTDEMKHATKYNYILNINALEPAVPAVRTVPQPRAAAPSQERTPDDWVRYINPLVQRALGESREGINPEHLYQEFILAGVLIGQGLTPQAAIETVEHWEKTGQSRLLQESKLRRLH